MEILVLTSICLTLGGYLYAQRVVLLNKCLAAGMLLLRFHCFITALLMGTTVGGMFVREADNSLMLVAFVLKVLFVIFCNIIPLF